MHTNSKIARLSRDLRERLNRRLQNDEPPSRLLEWLNALPEVKTLLASEFASRPITKQNLSDWKQHGFREWEIRQAALEFAQNLDADDGALNQKLTGPLTEKLAHWIALRYAAAAHALSTTDDDPETELRRLRQFCGDIVALRRGDLSAGRLKVEQARLAAEQAENNEQQERQFWEWTLRPDIQAKLRPELDPDKLRQEVVKMLDRELLGIRPSIDLSEATPVDPAVWI